MTIHSATHVVPYRPALVEGTVSDRVEATQRPRRSPPVERVVEGEVLGRQRFDAGATADQLGHRLRLHASVDNGDAWRAHVAVASYLGVAGAPTARSASTLDLYA